MAIPDAAVVASGKLDQVWAAGYTHEDHRNAVAILTLKYPELLGEICDALLAFRVTHAQIKQLGANESEIPRTFSRLLRPNGWLERKLTAKRVIEETELVTNDREVPRDTDHVVSIDTHKIDYVKGKVALDLEWNSKDQTFDRDLYAFGTFFEYRKIEVGVLVTRDDSLDALFRGMGTYMHPKLRKEMRYSDKYGARHTHMSKLVTRLRAGRGGGCPVLAVGIPPQRVVE